MESGGPVGMNLQTLGHCASPLENSTRSVGCWTASHRFACFEGVAVRATACGANESDVGSYRRWVHPSLPPLHFSFHPYPRHSLLLLLLSRSLSSLHQRHPPKSLARQNLPNSLPFPSHGQRHARLRPPSSQAQTQTKASPSFPPSTKSTPTPNSSAPCSPITLARSSHQASTPSSPSTQPTTTTPLARPTTSPRPCPARVRHPRPPRRSDSGGHRHGQRPAQNVPGVRGVGARRRTAIASTRRLWNASVWRGISTAFRERGVLASRIPAGHRSRCRSLKETAR